MTISVELLLTNLKPKGSLGKSASKNETEAELRILSPAWFTDETLN